MKKHSVNNNNINNNMNVSIVSNWKQQHKLQNTKNAKQKKQKTKKRTKKKMLGVMLSWAPVKLLWQPRLTWSMRWVQLGPYKVSR